MKNFTSSSTSSNSIHQVARPLLDLLGYKIGFTNMVQSVQTALSVEVDATENAWISRFESDQPEAG
jgi:hypothetical protein